ncbi:hypothetical protein [Streptomyces sp. t39]|uniref:hypothetical protein n=1 Tax=Streptomyces sp. t39 TaxID=1828156 RepID=UPI0011CE0CC5|nr:hypothetical protein [Streptomyces sp. t39]
MEIPGVLVYLHGPAEAQQPTLEALRAAGIAAVLSVYELGKIEAWFTDGSDSAPPEFVNECRDRAAAAAEAVGFTVQRAVLWGGGPNRATSMHIVDTQTGELCGIVDTAHLTPFGIEEKMQRCATELGIPFSRLELQDPPGFRIENL